MSMRSELLFAAQRKIPNPFLLCAVTSARARQLMVARDGQAAPGEVVDYALREVAAGALEFELWGQGVHTPPFPLRLQEKASKS